MGNTHEIDDKGKDREMMNHLCCRNPDRIDGHLIFYKPYSYRLGNNDDYQSKQNLDIDSCGIHLIQLRSAAFSHFKRY